MYYAKKYCTAERRFQCAFVSLGYVGIGSTLFHGNLTQLGQVLDEVPMMYMVFSMLYILLEMPRTKPDSRRGLQILLFATCTLLVSVYIYLNIYAVFTFSFVGVCGSAAFTHIFQPHGKTRLTTLLTFVAVGSFILAGVLWLIDHFYCSQAQWLHLHMYWHYLSMFGGYMFIESLLCARATTHKCEPYLLLPNVYTLFGMSKTGSWGLEIRANRRSPLKGAFVVREVDEYPEFLLPFVGYRKMKSRGVDKAYTIESDSSDGEDDSPAPPAPSGSISNASGLRRSARKTPRRNKLD